MEFDIVIIGGGLVGASLASALKNSGLRLALIEGQPLPSLDSGWDSRIYAFTPGNVGFLKDCGAWQRLDMSRVQQVEEMRVFGDTGSRLNFSAYEIGAPELAFIMESRLLQHALWEGLSEQDNLTLIQPAQCAEMSLQDDAAHLKLKDGREIRAKLIVGADGRDSWARHQAVMPEVADALSPARSGRQLQYRQSPSRYRLSVVHAGRHPCTAAVAGKTHFHRLVGQSGAISRIVGTHSRRALQPRLRRIQSYVGRFASNHSARRFCLARAESGTSHQTASGLDRRCRA